MNTTQKIRMLFWLTSLINRKGPITLSEINAEWVRRDDSNKMEIERNTFRNYLVTIQELFDVNIPYKQGKGYYIENPSALYKQNIQNSLLEHLQNIDFYTLFRSLGKQIHTENFANGTRYLAAIGEALKKRRCIVMEYQKFVDDDKRTYSLIPCCIKADKRRWYLVAKKQENHKTRIFALDRILSIEITKTPFSRRFLTGVDERLSRLYGVYDDGSQPEKILIQANETSAKYLRTLPLHHSQKEIKPLVFRYYMCVTTDFANELLRYGNQLKVLHPQKLCDMIVQKAKDISDTYQNQNTYED